MAIPYVNNIPNATDLLSQSQPDLKTNTQGVSTFVNINHVDFASADAGKHKFLQMPEQGAAPATAANEAGFYAAVGATSTVTELVFRRENNGVSIPMTEASLAASGWSYLPSGLMIQWGGPTNITNAGTVVAFPRAFPNAAYNISLTSNTNSGNNWFIMATGLGVNGFTGWATTRSGGAVTASVYWFAIGR